MATEKIPAGKIYVSVRRFDAKRIAQHMPRMPPPNTADNEERCDRTFDGLQGFGVTVEASGEAQAITLIASVSPTYEGWRPLAEGEIVVVRHRQVVASHGSPACA